MMGSMSRGLLRAAAVAVAAGCLVGLPASPAWAIAQTPATGGGHF